MHVYYVPTPYPSKAIYLDCTYCVGKILNLETVIEDMYLNCEEEELGALQVTPRAASGGKRFRNLVYSLSGVRAILYK